MPNLTKLLEYLWNDWS